MATVAEKTGRILLALAALLALGLLIANAASAGPLSTRVVHTPGEIVPIPASIPHEEGDMVDSRIVPEVSSSLTTLARGISSFVDEERTRMFVRSVLVARMSSRPWRITLYSRPRSM